MQMLYLRIWWKIDTFSWFPAENFLVTAVATAEVWTAGRPAPALGSLHLGRHALRPELTRKASAGDGGAGGWVCTG